MQKKKTQNTLHKVTQTTKSLSWNGNPVSLAALETLNQVAAHTHNATAYVCLTFGEKDPE